MNTDASRHSTPSQGQSVELPSLYQADKQVDMTQTKKLTRARFELAPPKRVRPERTALDHSATLPYDLQGMLVPCAHSVHTNTIATQETRSRTATVPDAACAKRDDVDVCGGNTWHSWIELSNCVVTNHYCGTTKALWRVVSIESTRRRVFVSRLGFTGAGQVCVASQA